VRHDQVRRTSTPSPKLTYDEFLRFPDDGNRHELIDGDHYVTPSPSIRHQEISMNLAVELGLHLKQHRNGVAFFAPLDVVFSNWDVVEPDMLYVSRERANVLAGKHVRGAPDLVAEILSPSTRKTDEVTKRELYERWGVAEYWMIDPERETISVHRRVNDTFQLVAELSVERGDMLTTPLLPAFSVPLGEVFASGLAPR
jgi:Uma2 family endonuclease